MSNQDPEKLYDNFADMLTFAFRQMLKGVFTCIPGTTVVYEPTTKRIQVRPALDIVRTDDSRAKHPTVVNVPVVFPSAGGFVLTMPIQPGDPVLILFSQRGLVNYKRTFEDADPDTEGFFSEKDAVVIAGFGALEITPATLEGTSLQTEDGTNHVYVEDGHIQITTPQSVQTDCDTEDTNCATAHTTTCEDSSHTSRASRTVDVGTDLTTECEDSSHTSRASRTVGAGVSVTINSPWVRINGRLEVDGDIWYSGSLRRLDGQGPASMTGGLVNTGGDIVSDGISLETHIHTGDDGGDTSAPHP